MATKRSLRSDLNYVAESSWTFSIIRMDTKITQQSGSLKEKKKGKKKKEKKKMAVIKWQKLYSNKIKGLT